MPSPISRIALLLWLALLFPVPGLPAQNLAETAGTLRFEAEQPATNTPRAIDGTTYSWTASTALPGFSGSGFMEALPNDGTSVEANWSTTSPELAYTISFTNPGTYFVWLRVFAENSENAVVHIGLNGSAASQAAMGVTQYNAWRWTNTPAGSATPVSVSVPTAGTYTFSIWMNDAGFRVDRVLLTRNRNFSPEYSADFWRNQNIYQIITDRFFNGNPSNDNFYGWADPKIGNKTHGGDFLGIEKKLDYIRALGATAIWISPVVKNGAGDFDYHGYAGTDFYNTDPRFGSLADLQRLVAEAHKRGILVVNDVVTNHASTWVDSGDTGWPNFKYPPSGYNLRYNSGGNTFAPPFDNATLQSVFGNTNLANIFNNNGAIQNFGDITQVELGELSSLDDFRTQSQFVRDKMAEIYSYWIRTVGFDAFRIDTVKHVEMGFWDNWSPRIRAAAAAVDKPNFFQFGEVYDGSDAKCGSYTGSKTTAPFKMESVVDYPLYYQVGSVFATATGATKQIEDRYANLNSTNYDPSALNSLVTFLDNHDVNRFLNAGGGTARLQVALAFLYTSRGIPCLYYGTEQDFDGGADPWNREDMFAGQFEGGPSVGDNFNMTHPRFKLVAKLNNLRRLYPELRTGIHWNLWNNPTGPGLLAYARRIDGLESYVVLNTASSQQTIGHRPTVNPPGTVLVNLFNTSEKLTVINGSTGWEIPPFTAQPNSYAIFVAESRLQALNPVVETVSPAHDASSVPVGSGITLSFSQPMNTASTQAAFSTSPATTGSFVWSDNNTVLTYTPAGLAGNTLYNVHLVAGTADASNVPILGTFESRFATAASTGASRPAVASQSSSVTGDNSATISASVNPNGAATTVYFEYGPTSAYGTLTANQSIPTGTTYVTRNASLTDLVPGTTYHYRVVATNSAGTTYGPDATFTTTITVPETTAITSPASSITTNAAVLNGIVNPNGNPTTAYFQYGILANQLTERTPDQSLGSGSSALNISAPLSGIQPDTVYFYRVVATNPIKTVTGATISFATLPVKPTLTNTSTDAVEPFQASVGVTVNPNGSDSQVWFEYGTGQEYGFTSPAQSVSGSVDAAVRINGTFADLVPGQTYHYRAAASNAFGISYGQDQSFTTGFPPPSVLTGKAVGITNSSANLTATINPNGPETVYWFEYGTTTALGSSTLLFARDDAEDYTSLSYSSTNANAFTTQNGGDGFGAFRTYVRTDNTRGGIRLVTANSTGGTANRQIDAAQSICFFAGTSTARGTHSSRRALTVPRRSGTVSFSVRFDIANTVGFTGVNLKSADGSSFGASELLSIGMQPLSGQIGGNTALVLADGVSQRNIDLGSEVRGRILDVWINFDCLTGLHSTGVKFREDEDFNFVQGSLKFSGATVNLAFLGFINGCNTGSNSQNLILDGLEVSTPDSAGSGSDAVPVARAIAGLSANATYFYRAVAASSAGQSAGTTTTFYTGNNTAPSISSIPDVSAPVSNLIGPIAFTIQDNETPAEALAVSVSSDNAVLFPESSFLLGGSGANRTLSLTPAAGLSGIAEITVTVGDGQLESDSRFLVTVGDASLPPSLSDFQNLVVEEDAAPTTISFTVSDADSPLEQLIVTAASSDPVLVPAGNLLIGGSGANRTLTLAPAPDRFGNATITVTVDDGFSTASKSFQLTVTPVNDAPVIGALENRKTAPGVAVGPIEFTVGDVETDPALLVVTAASDNEALVPVENISLSGSGASRMVTVLPVETLSGFATITLTVSDGELSASSSFVLEVNEPPTIDPIADQAGFSGYPTAPIPILINDAETPLDDLLLSATTNNSALVPPGAFVFEGSGAARTLVITPAANLEGNATITVRVDDGSQNATRSFVLAVGPAPDIAIEKSEAFDSTADAAYDDGVYPGKNGGHGFGAWSGSGEGGGHYLGGSGLGARSFAIYAGGGEGTSFTASRGFETPMETGETFRVRLGYTGVANGGQIGMRLRSGGAERFVLRFLGGQSEWVVNDGVADAATGIPWSGGSPGLTLHVAITRHEGNGYRIELRSGSSFFSANRTGSSGEMAIDAVEFFTIAQGGGENLGFDQLERSAAVGPLVDFGAVGLGQSGTPARFVAHNLGAGILSGISLSLAGEHAGDFSTNGPAESLLQPGMQTGFSAGFLPLRSGGRTATLLVASNDPDENPVFIFLAGTGWNTAPTISDIGNQTHPVGPIAFQIGDAETDPALLNLTAQSSNEDLVPVSNIVFEGSGAIRTVAIQPVGELTGSAQITITVDDGDLSASRSFLFTVPGGGYSEWSELESLPEDRRDPLDRNGPLDLPNLLAYAMGVNPLTATVADLPAVKSVDSAAGEVTVVYRRSTTAEGVTLELVGSTDLAAGVWEAAEILGNSDGEDFVEVRVAVPPGDRYFLRLRAGME
jgi:glycosidase